jgi:hypothetical protein
MCSIDRVAIVLPRLSSALLAGEALFFLLVSSRAKPRPNLAILTMPPIDTAVFFAELEKSFPLERDRRATISRQT